MTIRMKSKKNPKKFADSKSQIMRYEMEKKSLYYTCKTQEELNRKLQELAQRFGV